jgi:glycosyltransferase involved in cell wall biosynthesis
MSEAVAELEMPALVRPGLEAPERPASAVRPWRVCHLSVNLATGGLERLLVEFARHHDRSQFELTFVATDAGGRPAEEIADQGCQVLVQGGRLRGRLRRILGLARLFRAGQFDVIHTHNAFPHIYGVPAARLAGVPVVLQTRHGPRFGRGLLARWQYRLACRLGSRVVAVSDDAARIFRMEEGLPAGKLVRIWNGIDLSRFPCRESAGVPRAITVARLSAEKDIATMIHAAARVAQQVPGFELQIVGDGPQRPELEAQARALGLAGVVRFLGERNDVAALLSQAGFYVSSSLIEGISLTLLEAMAVGLPVVATSVGGNPEVVVDGQTGWLVPPQDPEHLAAAMLKALAAQASWSQLGRRGRQRVEDRFDVVRMVRDYEALYTRELCLAGASRGGARR